MLKLLNAAAVALLLLSANTAQAALVIQSQTLDVAEGQSGPIVFDILVQAQGQNETILSFNLPTQELNDAIGTFDSFAANGAFLVSGATPLTTPPFASAVGLNGANGALAINDGQILSIGTMTFNLVNAPAGITAIAAFADTGFDANFFQFETAADGTNPTVINDAVYSVSATSAIPEPGSLLALCAMGGVSVMPRRRR